MNTPFMIMRRIVVEVNTVFIGSSKTMLSSNMNTPAIMLLTHMIVDALTCFRAFCTEALANGANELDKITSKSPGLNVNPS